MQPFEHLSARGQIGRLASMARIALRAYALPAARRRRLRHQHTTTFRVETAAGERYVLRINRPGHQSARAVRSDLLWLQALSSETPSGVLAPVIVAAIPLKRADDCVGRATRSTLLLPTPRALVYAGPSITVFRRSVRCQNIDWT